MIILFVGPQASGKGTQAKIVAEKKGFAHVSTGDLLRNARGDLKKLADNYIKEGKLVPSNIMISILKERLKKSDCELGVILDGFPRTLNQAEDLEKIAEIDKVFEISISDDTAKKRLMGRWNCKQCGKSYNLVTQPRPKEDKLCDVCNIPLFQRDDDKDENAIDERLRIYHFDTEPILKRYGNKVIRIDGERSIGEITEDILENLE
jgi:adenylate kinase